jgi:hypothetical protein
LKAQRELGVTINKRYLLSSYLKKLNNRFILFRHRRREAGHLRYTFNAELTLGHMRVRQPRPYIVSQALKRKMVSVLGGDLFTQGIENITLITS